MAALLAACSPALDWREVHAAAQGYSATYPARPGIATRQIELGGRRLTMTLGAAEVGDRMFAVGVLDLPAATPEWQAQGITWLRDGLLASLSGAQPVDTAVEVPTAARDKVPAIAVAASGVAADQRSRRLAARFVARGARAYQVVVMASGSDADSPAFDEAADQFLRAFILD